MALPAIVRNLNVARAFTIASTCLCSYTHIHMILLKLLRAPCMTITLLLQCMQYYYSRYSSSRDVTVVRKISKPDLSCSFYAILSSLTQTSIINVRGKERMRNFFYQSPLPWSPARVGVDVRTRRFLPFPVPCRNARPNANVIISLSI